jgi:ATP-dependent DNA ligase
MPLPLSSRKARLAAVLERPADAVRYSDHQIGHGQAFHRHACKLRLEGIVSKRLDAGYSPGQRGLWLKTKCLNREEFVVVGWTDPEGAARSSERCCWGTTVPTGRLVYAGRVGSGMRADQLSDLWKRLQPLRTDKMPLDTAPPRTTRFGSPLVLLRVHWVRPELVVEVTYLTWTDDGLLRQVVYEGLREDKPARDVTRPLAATETVATGRKS